MYRIVYTKPIFLYIRFYTSCIESYIYLYHLRGENHPLANFLPKNILKSIEMTLKLTRNLAISLSHQKSINIMKNNFITCNNS